MEFTFSVISGDKKVVDEVLQIFDGFQGFRCLWVSRDYEEALRQVLEQRPTIIFMDIDEKEKEEVKNPLLFTAELRHYFQQLPFFVALSSSEKKAYRIFKSGFLDYLLMNDLQHELKKFIMKFQTEKGGGEQDRICLKSYSDYRFIYVQEILYLKADNNTTDFFLTQDRKVSAYKILRHFEEILPTNFLRVHNSFIVNTHHISRINFAKSLIGLRGKCPDIPFSRSYKPQVDHLKESFFDGLSLVS